MFPKMEFEERSRRRRCGKEPNDGGIWPEILVDERLRSCREEREESCGGIKERLRNVFGIEREMTLFCGEHVTPCHEHGVIEDEFHDERTADEVLERESAEVRSESSV